MARVFSRERTFMAPVLRPMERLLYRVAGVDEDQLALKNPPPLVPHSLVISYARIR